MLQMEYLGIGDSDILNLALRQATCKSRQLAILNKKDRASQIEIDRMA